MRRSSIQPRPLVLLLALLVGCCGLSNALLAQVTTAAIHGTVTDSTGGVIPGAEVTATQVATNFKRTTVTDEVGQYAIKFLPLGRYKVEVAVPGFKTFSQTGVVLDINRDARVDATLSIGEQSETISVASDAPLVNTTDASIGRTVNNAEIQNLPLVNRDVYTLLSLTPGVNATDATNPLGSPAEIVVVNGSSSGTGSISYYLDGGNNTAGLRNTGNSVPNPDAVQEFRVITNNYSSEFGRFAGGMVDVVTKSGTNTMHGSLFEYVRNDALNASPWLVSSKPPLRRNQFGGSFGGPVMKDKTFYFGSYSGLRQRQVVVRNTAIVPTEAERKGDFSNSKVKPNDPLTKKPFANNIIPTERLDPTAQKIISTSIPAANLPGNFVEATQQRPLDTDEVQLKIDHQLSSTHQLSGSYYWNSGLDLESLQGNLVWSRRAFDWTQQNLNIADTWTISPTLVNQLRLTYVRNFGGRINTPATSLADFGSNFRVQGTPSLPQITVSGYFNLSQAIAGPLAGSNYYGVRENLSWTRGRHFLKMGGEFALEKNIHAADLNNYGVFNFDGSKSGNALADFILGVPRSMNQDAPICKYDDGWYYGLYFQDDFRIHPRLMLNLGLRYDLQTPFTDPYDRKLTFVLGQQSKVVPSAPLGLVFPGDPGIGRGIIEADKNNFAPRIGLAWDPFGDGRTSIRAAAGLFVGSISANEWNQTGDRQPFTARQQFNTVKSFTDPYGSLPGGVSPYPYVYDPANPKFLEYAAITGTAIDFQWPYTYQFNLSIQRQVTNDLSVTAAYVGANGYFWPTIRDYNYPVYGPGATSSNVNDRRPIQPKPKTYSTIAIIESVLNNSYHGLQLSADKRFSRGVSFRGFYTLGKALEGGNLAAANGDSGMQNANKLAAEKGRTPSDRLHNFVLSTIWELNYFKGSNVVARSVLNNWMLAAIMRAGSGTPLTIASGRDNNLDGNGNDRANLVGDPLLDPNRPRSEVMEKWFNTAAFTQNAAGQDGTAGRNIIDRPGFKTVDFALSRDFRLFEEKTLQFRCEMTNAFNLVNLAAPTTNVNSSAFGTIRSAGNMREVQLGLRFTF
ncbi:MAG: TonB-dependent receptor [Acidobacteria bacterium]|nr:MAG: TonB-dependent receptor [Acidobacteriota bacterium]